VLVTATTSDGETPRTFDEVMLMIYGLAKSSNEALLDAARDLASVTPLSYEEAVRVAREAVNVFHLMEDYGLRTVETLMKVTATFVQEPVAQVPAHEGEMSAEEAWQQYGKPAYEQHVSGRRMGKGQVSRNMADAVAWLEAQERPDAPLERRRAMAEIKASGTRISVLENGRFAVYVAGRKEPTVVDRVAMERFISIHQGPGTISIGGVEGETGTLTRLAQATLPATLPQSMRPRETYGFTPMRPDREVR
jgi:hypothetical protein